MELLLRDELEQVLFPFLRRIRQASLSTSSSSDRPRFRSVSLTPCTQRNRVTSFLIARALAAAQPSINLLPGAIRDPLTHSSFGKLFPFPDKDLLFRANRA